MSITLSGLLIGVGIAAIILTAITAFFFKEGHKSWLMTFLQNYTGALFVFSGLVKAVDPLGTAYKMEQYFNEFAYTFEPTWFGFIAPIFPWFNNYSVVFSVVMIVFEIILGLMLIMGVKGKLTSWLFLSLVGFFTFLTGFTYLTGYVPNDGNFFSFGSWTEYNANNMKVTDCGCFGDFLKLEPKVSFFKDIALLFPAVFFMFKHEDMHQWFSKKVSWIILGLSTVGLLFYCFSNYIWDLPHEDFRPFRIDADVASIREAEENAAASVQITDWTLENTNTKEVVTIPTAEYYAGLSTNYAKAKGWTVLEQIKTEPAMKPTKISDFDIKDYEGHEVTYDYLDPEAGQNFMIVSHKMYGEPKMAIVTIQDTTFVTDTISIDGVDIPQVVRSVGEIKSVEKEVVDYIWDENWKADYVNLIKPLLEKAKKDGHAVSIVFGGADKVMADDFAGETGIKADYYNADDILLKTIVRSNPGIVLWDNGKIEYKWHKKKLPSYEVIKNAYLK
ncbi:MAG: putative membrane protein YphA (DoxX/SURF4 family) [Saprospiraceae bacterium]|jgi:uncharacterized membrane protein YphA (DoxX/SURF4 family)